VTRSYRCLFSEAIQSLLDQLILSVRREELLKIDQIFLTHSHLDHIVSIPFLADAVGAKRSTPITVYGLPETLQAFHQKIFHDHIWPDFTVIPSPEKPFIRFVSMRAGETIKIGQRSITSIPVNHVVPAVGYVLTAANGASLAFSGDTTSCPTFWQQLSKIPNLKHVIVECSFRDAELKLAEVSKHYCPSLLARDLDQFKSQTEIHISHTKPGETYPVLDGLKKHLSRQVLALHQGDQISF